MKDKTSSGYRHGIGDTDLYPLDKKIKKRDKKSKNAKTSKNPSKPNKNNNQ